MASIITAGNSTNNGASVASDNTGILQIKTGPSAGTTAVTVDASQVVTLANSLPVASGGTGQTTYKDGQLLIGNSTGNTLTKATLTAGSGVTITNGSGAITIAASGGAGQTQMAYAVHPTTVFNSTGSSMANTGTGTFNWTCPTGVTKVRVTVIAGGGGNNNDNCSAGAGYGGFALGIYTVTPGTVYAVTVGAGGAAGTPAGSSGGSSSFSSLATATGGAGAPASGAGANGAGANGNLKTGFSMYSADGQGGTAGIPIFGLGPVSTAGTSTSQAWSPSANFHAGARGSIGTTLYGGATGVVAIEWVG